MSAVGADAEYMLEKALEEMDDIFKDGDPNQVSHTFIKTSSTLVQQIQQKTPSKS